MKSSVTNRLCVFAFLLAAVAQPASAQEYEHEPIQYSKSDPHNRVSLLVERIRAGKTKLRHEPHFGYLRSLLAELEVPQSSQMLVYSKTSLQRHRIAPNTPRALYFNDDVYVGFCQQGDVLELSAVDPQLGAVFYTVDQHQDDAPRFTRQGDNCLICHSSSHTKDVPGHLVRSVFTDTAGFPILSAGSYRIDHTSPLEKRWGGWYVTGTHGTQKHLGNLTIEVHSVPRNLDNSEGMNLTKLGNRIPSAFGYLSGHSDIVALMVLEHQTDAQNLIGNGPASHDTTGRCTIKRPLNRELQRAGRIHVWESTKSRIKSRSASLWLSTSLFSGEAELTGRIARHLGVCERVCPTRTARSAGPIPARLRPRNAAVQVSLQLSDLFRELLCFAQRSP